MHNIEWIEDFRASCFSEKHQMYTIEYKLEGEEGWYDLFEDCGKEICELIVQTLKEKLLNK